jgi:hypothetical protein
VEWPPRSPDLTPLEFYLWAHLKAMVYQVKIQNVDNLKERIRDACARTTPDVLKRVRHEWERHMSMCYQCNGRDTYLCAINVMGETHVCVLSM